MRCSRLAIILILTATMLSACGGNTPASPPTPVAGDIPGAEIVPTLLAELPPDMAATAQALATDPTAMAELQATILAEKPSEDGCDPQQQNINPERANLTATWTDDARINLKGTVDAPEDALFLVFVFNNGAPIYWANFPEIQPVDQNWDFTTTRPSADDVVMGDLAKQNPYEPGDKICVGVTALKAGVDLTSLTDAAAAQEALHLQLRLPVGGTAPAAVALPTANPAGGEGICNEEGELTLARFKDLAPLVAGAYADARQGAQTWQPDARLYQMEVGCAILGGLRWDFSWISDTAKDVATNSPDKPAISEEDYAPDYENVVMNQTVDPAAVSITFDKLGDALIADGFAESNMLALLGRITLGFAAENSTLVPPTGGASGPYYVVAVAANADDRGERVYVDANTGTVFK